MLERYDDVLLTVLRPARHVESEERVEFGQLHVFDTMPELGWQYGYPWRSR